MSGGLSSDQPELSTSETGEQSFSPHLRSTLLTYGQTHPSKNLVMVVLRMVAGENLGRRSLLRNLATAASPLMMVPVASTLT